MSLEENVRAHSHSGSSSGSTLLELEQEEPVSHGAANGNGDGTSGRSSKRHDGAGSRSRSSALRSKRRRDSRSPDRLRDDRPTASAVLDPLMSSPMPGSGAFGAPASTAAAAARPPSAKAAAMMESMRLTNRVTLLEQEVARLRKTEAALDRTIGELQSVVAEREQDLRRVLASSKDDALRIAADARAEATRDAEVKQKLLQEHIDTLRAHNADLAAKNERLAQRLESYGNDTKMYMQALNHRQEKMQTAYTESLQEQDRRSQALSKWFIQSRVTKQLLPPRSARKMIPAACTGPSEVAARTGGAPAPLTPTGGDPASERVARTAAPSEGAASGPSTTAHVAAAGTRTVEKEQLRSHILQSTGGASTNGVALLEQTRAVIPATETALHELRGELSRARAATTPDPALVRDLEALVTDYHEDLELANAQRKEIEAMLAATPRVKPNTSPAPDLARVAATPAPAPTPVAPASSLLLAPSGLRPRSTLASDSGPAAWMPVALSTVVVSVPSSSSTSSGRSSSSSSNSTSSNSNNTSSNSSGKSNRGHTASGRTR